jgi:hypothetical protein
MNWTSDKIDKIAPALLAAQRDIKGAKKDSVNPGLKNKYADLASVFEACKKELNDNGILIIQPMGVVDGTSTQRTVLLHESGQYMASEAFLPAIDPNKGINAAQAMGSAISYMRRYQLSAMAGVLQEDDDGNAAGQKAEPVKAIEPNAVETAKAKEIAENLKEATNTPHLINKWAGFGGNDNPDIPVSLELAKLPESLQKRLRATYDLVHGELKAKYKAEKDAEALAKDAERGEG